MMQAQLEFDGKTFDHVRDQARLTRQAQKVWDVMKDGRWRMLREISMFTKCPEASVSARLRDLRKPRNGGWDVQRRHMGNGLHEYRISI